MNQITKLSSSALGNTKKINYLNQGANLPTSSNKVENNLFNIRTSNTPDYNDLQISESINDINNLVIKIPQNNNSFPNHMVNNYYNDIKINIYHNDNKQQTFILNDFDKQKPLVSDSIKNYQNSDSNADKGAQGYQGFSLGNNFLDANNSISNLNNIHDIKYNFQNNKPKKPAVRFLNYKNNGNISNSINNTNSQSAETSNSPKGSYPQPFFVTEKSNILAPKTIDHFQDKKLSVNNKQPAVNLCSTDDNAINIYFPHDSSASNSKGVLDCHTNFSGREETLAAQILNDKKYNNKNCTNDDNNKILFLNNYNNTENRTNNQNSISNISSQNSNRSSMGIIRNNAKDAKEDDLNPFNLNFFDCEREQEKFIPEKFKNDDFSIYNNNQKEEEAFLGFDNFTN